MKQFVFISIFALLTVSTFAQKGEKHERIEALRTAYLTQELEMSSEDAQRFWPIYNSYDKEAHELKKLERKVKDIYKSDEDLTEDVARETLEDLKRYYKQSEVLKNKLIDDLLAEFDPIFVLKFKKADYKFRLELLKKYRNKE